MRGAPADWRASSGHRCFVHAAALASLHPPLVALVGSYALKVAIKWSRQKGLITAALTGNPYQAECMLKNYRLMARYDSGEFCTSPHAWKTLQRVWFHDGLNFSVVPDHVLLIALPSCSSEPRKLISQHGCFPARQK